MTARGLRNHNPGNIERGAPWQGLAADQSGDDRFAVFKAPEWGIRAIARILITYRDKYGLDTVRGIVNRWAPPVENDTDSYVRSVAGRLYVGPDDRINIEHFETARVLVEAIIKHENGSQPYSDATIRKGLVLAGIEVPVKPIEKSRTIKAGTVAAGATGAGVIVESVNQLAPALPILDTVGAYAKWLVPLLVIGAIGYMVWRRIDDQKVRVG